MSDNSLDLLFDRITNEDAVVFSRLKAWSAAPQVRAHVIDAELFDSYRYTTDVCGMGAVHFTTAFHALTTEGDI